MAVDVRLKPCVAGCWVRALALVTGIVVSTNAFANGASTRLVTNAADLAYNLDFVDARAALVEAIRADPSDPSAYRQLAGVYWMTLVFERHTPTVDDYIGHDWTPAPLQGSSSALVTGFRENLDRALQLAQAALQAAPSDPDAHMAVGAAIALQASYDASIAGRRLAAIRAARRSYDEYSTALRLDPSRHDAELPVGTYEYIVSTLSFPLRIIARLAGFPANRAHAIHLIENAASYPGANQSDARLLLAIIYNREQRYQDAIQIFTGLRDRYPRNRLLGLEIGSTLLRADVYREAEAILSEGLASLEQDARPHAFGEEALWHYKRGMARERVGDVAGATGDLTRAIEKDAEPWVVDRAHIEFGQLAERAGDRMRAKNEYETALRLARSCSDVTGAEDAKRLLHRITS